MRYAQIREYDVSNGPGVRVTLFVSGCTHNCKECFNKDEQSFSHGNVFTKEVEDHFIKYVKNENIVGVNILGGDPLQQDDSLYNLVKRIKDETKKNIWLWTGYKLEEIPEDKIKVLDYIDTLIDGRFEVDKRNINLKYRGSENQRVFIKDKNQFVLKEIDIF